MIRAYHPQTRATAGDWAAAFRLIARDVALVCSIFALVGAALKVL